MKVLVATAMYPTPELPAFGSFVKTQVESLQRIGVDAQPFVLAGDNRKLMYPQGMARLRRQLARNPVDVVHAHYSFVGAVARAQFSTPIVLTFHGDDLLGTVAADGRLTTKSKAIVAGGKLLSRFVDAVIVQSRQMAARLPRHPHVHVLPHEVDLDLFQPTPREVARQKLGLDAERPYLLFAAPPHIPVKNYPLAEATAAILRERNPAVELLVVFRETQERLALYMSACDALVFPSYQEGSPNIVKQAMACNLPIVATDVGDVAEVVSGTDDCYVVEFDPVVFADRLEPLLERRPRTHGRAAVSHLDSVTVAQQVLEVYEQVVERARAPRHRLRRAGA